MLLSIRAPQPHIPSFPAPSALTRVEGIRVEGPGRTTYAFLTYSPV